MPRKMSGSMHSLTHHHPQDAPQGPKENYLEIGVPLYEASIKCDWEAAKKILLAKPELVTYSITENGETALHIAASAKGPKHVEQFVQNLVEKMTNADLELVNKNHNTALYLAAAAGNLETVKIMVDKNKVLPQIPGAGQMLPLYAAALFGNHEVVKYLYECSKELSDDAWNPQNRGWLLEKCIESDMFDLTRTKERSDLHQNVSNSCDPIVSKLRENGHSTLTSKNQPIASIESYAAGSEKGRKRNVNQDNTLDSVWICGKKTNKQVGSGGAQTNVQVSVDPNTLYSLTTSPIESAPSQLTELVEDFALLPLESAPSQLNEPVEDFTLPPSLSSQSIQENIIPLLSNTPSVRNVVEASSGVINNIQNPSSTSIDMLRKEGGVADHGVNYWNDCKKSVFEGYVKKQCVTLDIWKWPTRNKLFVGCLAMRNGSIKQERVGKAIKTVNDAAIGPKKRLIGTAMKHIEVDAVLHCVYQEQNKYQTSHGCEMVLRSRIILFVGTLRTRFLRGMDCYESNSNGLTFGANHWYVSLIYIRPADLYISYASPLSSGQLSSSDWSEHITLFSYWFCHITITISLL
ncbi:ankyrin repeat-containing domain, PGG domain protein [Artemisia annua]|uniref:Ankyrin repeat-containing domain, PGG domain protein n=1 Tax=Artemisia annua TaxID=35608 RepID=A0A2U1L4J3_ARTAN|nr:ankyrin repeat-containing domain, PGG domain protein [Artemisia annua]